MELAFVALHKDCPKMDVTMTAPPKFAFEGSDEANSTMHLRCSLCAKPVDLTITEVTEPERSDEEDGA